jgi:hypothetical protein
MNLLTEVRRVLEKANYGVFQPQSSRATLHFEDRTIFGLVWIAPSVEQLLGQWQLQQDDFLKNHAKRLTGARSKTWNIYSVFLTDDASTAATRSRLAEIQEDFRSTRKIAQSDLVIPQDVVNALLPLVPIQSTTAESALSREKLRIKLGESVDRSTLAGLERIAATNDKKIRDMAIEEVVSLLLRLP